MQRAAGLALLLFSQMNLWRAALSASPLPGREWEGTSSLQGGQAETSRPHLPHYTAKRLLC